jgi:hypothetical protein
MPNTDVQHQIPETSHSDSRTPQSSTITKLVAASPSHSIQSHRTSSLLKNSLKPTQQLPAQTAHPSPKPSRRQPHKSDSTTPRSASAYTRAATPSSKKNPQSQNTTRSSATATAATPSATEQNKSWPSSKAKTSHACQKPWQISCTTSKSTWAARLARCIAFSSQLWRHR